MAAQENDIRDFMIGGELEEDPTDFVLGETLLSASRRSQMPKRKQPEPEKKGVLDLTSIEDLIAEELGDDGAPATEIGVSPSQDLTSPVAFEPEIPHAIAEPSNPQVEVTPLEEYRGELGEDFVVVEEAQRIYQEGSLRADQLEQEAKGLDSLARTSLRPMVSELQTEIREQQNILQDLIGQYIRNAEFDRVASVDRVKRNVDSLVLRIRGLDNRLQLPQEVAPPQTLEALCDPSLPPEEKLDQIYKIPRKGRKEGTDKKKAKSLAKATRTRRDPGASSPWVEKAKYLFIALVFLSTLPAYYLSANWGVQKVESIEIGVFQSVVPLENASKTGTTFHGIVRNSWREVSKEDKERAMEQFMAMVKVQGYETVILRYADGGFVTWASANSERVFLQ